jgi:hypothetical protein
MFSDWLVAEDVERKSRGLLEAESLHLPAGKPGKLFLSIVAVNLTGCVSHVL